MPRGRFNSPLEGALTGVVELMRRAPTIRDLRESDRLDGQTALITGGSSGVGLAVAQAFARRGAEVIIVGRRRLKEACARIESGAPGVSVRSICADLSDLPSLVSMVRQLETWDVRVDVLVDNAGIASPRFEESAQGFEAMFAVNVLAKAALIEQLVARHRLRVAPGGEETRARVLYTSSDSHQGAQAVDTASLGRSEGYGTTGSIHRYSYYKLVLNTWATELARRLDSSSACVSVHCICPGPVNTNIIRDAPGVLRLLLRGIFRVVFMAPEQSTPPFVYFAAAPEAQGTTNKYLHMRRPKTMDEKCYLPEAGAAVWARIDDLLEEWYARASLVRPSPIAPRPPAIESDQ